MTTVVVFLSGRTSFLREIYRLPPLARSLHRSATKPARLAGVNDGGDAMCSAVDDRVTDSLDLISEAS